VIVNNFLDHSELTTEDERSQYAAYQLDDFRFLYAKDGDNKSVSSCFLIIIGLISVFVVAILGTIPK